ncbi:acyl-CoA dehydrogenase family protein [Actinomadura sp. DC4]|uniref:acyl-CoA dehydrogenase family protein n=1 Tax=Actinomadura sp. DC4 TaxID=3055069 RepID=UPI0025B07DB8|nr:acyl-CoA dehydrogenase family protein [Actinomadura sp. DC4]MDN3358167.1 acyl-CoA dehydrogenase family protein [Actinomadura sp. DC4]
MDFAVTAGQRSLRERLRRFFEDVAPTAVVAEIDRTESFPEEIYARMAGFGLTRLGLPEEYGGVPSDEITMCVAVEEVARAGASFAYAWMPTVTFCARGIAKYGTPDQKRRFLPAICAGESRMAMGLSEPATGSDLSGLETVARRDGDEYVIDGHKTFTTGADTAEHILTLVRTGGGLTAIVVPRTAPGVSVSTRPKLSGQGTHACDVRFSDVHVPAGNVIGEAGDGFRLILSLLDRERVYVGAVCTGIAQGAFDLANGYARERVQFGKPIAEHQAVAHLLANMAMDVRTARLTTWEAAWRLDEDLPCSAEVSMTKVIASEAATRCVSNGMQVLGGYSYMVEYGMERYWREVKLNEIAGGTNQIQRDIIARHLVRTVETALSP